MYLTKVTNKIGHDIQRLSGISRYPFSIPEGSHIVIPTADEFGILARYSEVIFEKGKVVYKKMTDSTVLTESIYPGKVTCKIRKDWVEPRRDFPVVHFLNEGGALMESILLDVGNRLMLPRGIPVMSTVPCYSKYAQYKELIIHEDVRVEAQGGYDLFPNHEMKGKRSPQELDRIARMIREFHEKEKNRIRVM